MRSGFRWVFDNLPHIFAVGTAAVVAVTYKYNPPEIIPISTLSLLVSLTVFLAIKHYHLGREMVESRKSIDALSARIGGASYTSKVLNGREAFFKTLNDLFSEESKLDVTYFDPKVPERLDGKQRVAYWKTLADNLTKEGCSFCVRRIVTIDSLRKFEWVKSTISDCRSSNRYHLGYIDAPLDFPFLNIAILDCRFVIIFGHHSMDRDSRYVFIDDPKIAEIVSALYDEMWEKSQKIKHGDTVDEKLLSSIERRLRASPTARMA